MEGLIKIPAKLGCKGCIYEHDVICPADLNNGKLEFDFDVCTGEGQALIFVKTEEPNNKG